MSSTSLELDSEGAQELASLLADTVERAREIDAGAARRRRSADGDDGQHTELVIWQYERQPA